MSNFILSQLLACVAFTCGVLSFQCERRRSLLLWMSGSALTNACHFFLLGRIAPGALYITMGVRVFTAAFTTDRRLMYVFGGLILVSFAATYQRPLDLLAMSAALFATYGNFQKSDRKVRLIYMACAASWVVHNTLAGSPVAVLMELTFLLSNLIGYWRFYRLPAKV